MKLLASSFFIIVFFFLYGCKKSEISKQEKVMSDPSLLKGMVFLYDEGSTNSKDASGMTISVENSSPMISTVTDSKGEFSLKIDTAIKSFALVYSKVLYGSYKKYFVREGKNLYLYEGDWIDTSLQKKVLIENGDIGASTLGYKSSITVNSLQAIVLNGQLKLSCNVSAPGFIQLFYQKNLPNISFATIPKKFTNLPAPIRVQNLGNNSLDDFFTPSLYGISGFHSGDTIYMTAYGNSSYWNIYLDRTTNTMIMPNVNASNNITPVSFILP